MPSNPCDKVILPKITKKEKTTWTPEQIKSFLGWDELKKNKYYVMLLIAFHTGMRPGEIVGLRWNDIDGESFRVSQGLDKKKRATGLKTEGSHRVVYINKKISTALLVQRKWQTENKLLFGRQYMLSEYVFTHESGTCITPQQLYVHFQRLVKRYNQEYNESLPITPLYNARHSFGTNAIEAGAEVSALSKTMGHSTPKTTLNNYVHPRDSAQQKVMRIITDIY